MVELHLWTVYDHPRDMPDSFVARRYSIEADGLPRADQLALSAPDLATIRTTLAAAGLACLPRAPDDDPVILETWL